ncbi:hypothetical protein C162_05194 [Paenibacillus sp. FSL R7-269]|nr:hypothetical protein C162_05194 [Paenibacillus sp. FSL R7-269]
MPHLSPRTKQVQFSAGGIKKGMWEAFIRNLKLEHSPTFRDAMELIHTFLGPIYHNVLDDKDFFGDWNYQLLKWDNK